MAAACSVFVALYLKGLEELKQICLEMDVSLSLHEIRLVIYL